MKFFWTDTETTGVDPVKNGIIQIAGIIVINGQEMESFDLKCRPHPEDVIEPKALEVHGISEETIMGYPDPHDTYTKLLNIFSKYVNKFDKKDKFYAAGKNVRFDLNFLNEFFRKNGNPHPKFNCDGDPFFFSWMHHATFEVESLALQYELKQGKQVFPNYKLDTICAKMGIDLSNAHDAMADIEASRKVAKLLWKFIQGE